MALIIGSAVVSMFALAGTAFAAGNPVGPMAPGHMNFARPAVIGTVSAVNGDILTVASNSWNERRGFASTTPTSQPQAVAPASVTYTVDATNATVTKNNAASSVASIAVGDTVMVQGTVSGTNVTATTIRDGVMMRGGMKPGTGKGAPPQMQPGITGNGEPVVGGNITAINDSTLTITNKSNVTYTVDATSATIMKDNATSTLSSVAVGDNVVVQGTVNGSSVTASTVIDQGAPQTSSALGGAVKGIAHNFMGAIGGFFTRVFGFF